MCCIVLQWNCETGLWRPSSGRCCCWESLYSFLAWPLCNWPTTTSVPIRTAVISWFTMAPWGDAWHMLGFDMLGLFCKLALCPHCTIGMKDKFCKELESNLTSSQLFFEFALTLPWFQLWSTFLSSSQSFSQLFSSFSSLPTSAQLSSTLLASSHHCPTFLISSRLFSTHLNSPKFFPTLPNSFHANLLFWTGPHLFSLFFNCGQHFSALLRSSHLFPPLLLTSSPSNFIEVCSPHFFSTFLNFPHVLNSTSFWSQQFLATFSLFLSLCLTFTQKLVHTASICTLQHGEAFVQRSFCTKKLSHREAFSQIRFYIEMLSQREAFTQKLVHREAFAQTTSFYTAEAFAQQNWISAPKRIQKDDFQAFVTL